MDKKGVTITVEKIVFIILAIAIAVVLLVLISRMAPHLFDSIKDIF